MPELNSTEQITFLRPAALPGTELILATNASRGWHMFHERYAISACRTADARYLYRGCEHELNDRDTALLEPGEVHHNTWVNKPSDFKVLFIPAELFIDTAKDLGHTVTPHFRLPVVGNTASRLCSAVYKLSAAAERDDSILEQQSLFAMCMQLVLGYVEYRPPAPTIRNARGAIERARDYLKDRYRHQVGLGELCAVSRLSRYHLVRAFTRHVGLPPHAYQNHVRIERARKLLLAGVPAVEVASAVGFADQSHFTRHFARVMHTTPARYARRCLR